MPSPTQTQAALTIDSPTMYALVVFDSERGTIQEIGGLAGLESDLREHHTTPCGQVMAQVLSMRHFPAAAVGDRVYDPHT